MLNDSKNILITSGVIKDVLRHWILREIFNDMVQSGLYNAEESLGESEILALRSDDEKKIKQKRFELKKEYKKCAARWAIIFGRIG